MARQRNRRSKLRRIDHYPSGEASSILDQLQADAGVGISDILDHIIAERADIPEARGSPELHPPKPSEA
jgi:hypothetical protein